MANPLPVYVLSAPGSSHERLLAVLGDDATVLEPKEFLRRWDVLPPGVVFADRASLDPAELLAVAEPITAAAYGWTLALVGKGESPSVRVLSLAPRVALDEVASFARDPEGSPGPVLELQRVLTRVARVRHDLNNPLTSALAEVQLLLLDTEEGDAREALEVVQTQLRRIRDLIASTGHLRPAKP